MELTDNAVDMKAKCIDSGLLKFEDKERSVYEPEAMVHIHNAQAMWDHFFSWSNGNLFGFMIVTSMYVHVLNDKQHIKLPLCDITEVTIREGFIVPSLCIVMNNGDRHKFTFATWKFFGYRQTIRDRTKEAKEIIEIVRKQGTSCVNQRNQDIDIAAIGDTATERLGDPVPQRICTRCGASIVLGKPTGQMSCISIIAAVAFVVTLLLMIWACIHDISEGIGLSEIPFFWFLFILFISGAIALAGYIASQTINDSDCPECGGENTLIDINSPMGQKILAETENGRMSSVENQSNEDKGLPRSSDKMNDSICSSVEEYGIVQGESSTNVVSFCTECGAVRKQREKFCGRCGHKF